MNKITAFFLILIIGTLLGGVYGIVNDQFTYSISPEYYTKFKFIQFNFESIGLGVNIGDWNTPEIRMPSPRVGAVIVGFLATWWMGLIISIILGFVGLIHKTGKTMFKFTIKSFLVTIITAFIIGLIGMVYGKLFLLEDIPNWRFPNNLIDIDNFIIVGSIHNFSYLGGLIGLIAGIYYQYRQKRKVYQN